MPDTPARIPSSDEGRVVFTAEEEQWLTAQAGEPWAFAYHDKTAVALVVERRARQQVTPPEPADATASADTGTVFSRSVLRRLSILGAVDPEAQAKVEAAANRIHTDINPQPRDRVGDETMSGVADGPDEFLAHLDTLDFSPDRFTIPCTSWNYRLFHRAADQPEADYVIGEAYYDKAGTVVAWVTPIEAVGSTPDDLRRDLALMIAATQQPALNLADLEARMPTATPAPTVNPTPNPEPVEDTRHRWRNPSDRTVLHQCPRCGRITDRPEAEPDDCKGARQ